MSLILLGILNSQAAGGGAAAAYDLLETQILSTTASSVTFTGLDSYSDYKHLQVRMVATTASNFSSGRLRFNGVSTASYSNHYLRGDNGAVQSASNVSTTQIDFAFKGNFANVFTPEVFDILDFASTSKNTTVRSFEYYPNQTATDQQIYLRSGAFLSTNAVTSIEFSGSNAFSAGTRFSLYGIRG